MVDPITAVSGSIAIVQGIAQFYRFLHAQGDSVISAYFGPEGDLIEGDQSISVEIPYKEVEKGIWWFSVNGPEGYEFVRAPIIETGIFEIIGQENGMLNPNIKYWRWVTAPDPSTITNGTSQAPNVLVNFLVVGYKPTELLRIRG